MNIHVSLSSESISDAIAKLYLYREEMEHGVEQLVEILTEEGADVAQAAYGDWGVEAVPIVEETHGYIDVNGDMPLIAEFGAGDATLDPGSLFEHVPTTDVFPGSYSLEVGSGEYAEFGSWHFGGEKYTEVQPRQGLHMAKNYIIENYMQVVQEVFGGD